REVDPLSRHDVQGVARGLRGELPDPRLPGRRADHDLGPVSRRLAAARRGRSGDGRGARAHHRVLPVLRADALVHRARQDEAGAGTGDRMMKANTLVALLAALGAALSGVAFASGGADIRMEPAQVN